MASLLCVAALVPCDGDANTGINGWGTDTTATGATDGSRGAGSGGGGPAMEYRFVADCPGNSPDNATNPVCPQAYDRCANSQIWATTYQRPIGGAWTTVATGCMDPVVARVLTQPTEEQVRAEFLRTPFAQPAPTVQPPDHQSLVNLPVFYQLTWSTQGYRPGQTRTFTLLGHTVDLRITLAGITYTFGDGATLGPTPSMGGPWPDGDVHHTYLTSGTYSPTATTTLTADYRIDTGPWRHVPGTASLTTAFPTITVHHATNELIP